MQVGIYGGTFNPPHHAHVICAAEARLQLELDSVLMVPSAIPPHREIESDPGAEQRLAMMRLAVIGQPGLEVSTIELDRGGASWTVDTLEALVAQDPDTDYTLIIGADQALAFDDWREPARIAELSTIAVAARGEQGAAAAAEAVEQATGKKARVFAMPRIDIASSAIRDRVGSGDSVAHLVPAGVAELIEEAGLYR